MGETATLTEGVVVTVRVADTVVVVLRKTVDVWLDKAVEVDWVVTVNEDMTELPG